MFNILVVCTGNTCRSPMAEVLLRHKIKQSELTEEINVCSVGIYATGYSPASNLAQLTMKSQGMDLSCHTSRQVTKQLLQAAQLILTMTAAQKQALLQFDPTQSDKIFTLCEFVGQAGDVADPFGGDLDIYQDCALQISNLIDMAWKKIVALEQDKYK